MRYSDTIHCNITKYIKPPYAFGAESVRNDDLRKRAIYHLVNMYNLQYSNQIKLVSFRGIIVASSAEQIHSIFEKVLSGFKIKPSK